MIDCGLQAACNMHAWLCVWPGGARDSVVVELYTLQCMDLLRDPETPFIYSLCQWNAFYIAYLGPYGNVMYFILLICASCLSAVDISTKDH